MRNNTSVDAKRRMSMPGLPYVTSRDVAWAMSGIRGEMDKLRYMSPKLQGKRGKPGSPVSICVIKIASLVKGCPEIPEDEIRLDVFSIMSSWESKPARIREFGTMWLRAMENCKGRQRNG